MLAHDINTGGTCCSPDNCLSLYHTSLFATARVCVGLGSEAPHYLLTWPSAKLSTV